MKITAAQREFFRYAGVSADLERRGFGASRIDNAWTVRIRMGLDELPPSSTSRQTPDAKR